MQNCNSFLLIYAQSCTRHYCVVVFLPWCVANLYISTDLHQSLIQYRVLGTEALVMCTKLEKNCWTSIMPSRLSMIESKSSMQYQFSVLSAAYIYSHKIYDQYIYRCISFKSSIRKALREVLALSDLHHHNIVRYYNCWREETEYEHDSRSTSQ